jgi:hypothetical protein
MKDQLVARPVPTQDNTTQSKHKHPCPKRDSNPRLSVPQTARSLNRRAITVLQLNLVDIRRISIIKNELEVWLSRYLWFYAIWKKNGFEWLRKLIILWSSNILKRGYFSVLQLSCRTGAWAQFQELRPNAHISSLPRVRLSNEVSVMSQRLKQVQIGATSDRSSDHHSFIEGAASSTSTNVMYLPLLRSSLRHSRVLLLLSGCPSNWMRRSVWTLHVGPATAASYWQNINSCGLSFQCRSVCKTRLDNSWTNPSVGLVKFHAGSKKKVKCLVHDRP